MKKLEIGMRSLKEMGADVLEAWKNVEAGRKVGSREALYFSSMPRLLAVLTPARWNLLEVLKCSGPLTIYALAKELARNYSNVHSDVTKLLALDLLRKNEQGCVYVPWDEIHADFSLKVAA